jgi:hypothetical protein
MNEQKVDVFETLLEGRVSDLAGEKDPSVIKQIVNETADKAKALPNPKDFDVWIYRGTVFVLGAVAIIVAYAQYRLAIGNVTEIPEGLIAIGAAAIGALAGLLAPTGGR